MSVDFLAELDAEVPGWANAEWDRAIGLLKVFIADNGHARVAQSHVEDGFKLGEWVKGQRQARKRGKLSDARIAELDALGFTWVVRVLDGDGWQRGMDALRAYIAAGGHARVPRSHVEDGYPLGAWVGTRRQARKNGRLSADRIAELDALGFIWDVHDIGWQRGTGAVRAYIAANGHARVPKGHVEGGFALGTWVCTQRQVRKRGTLSDGRIAELDALGFIWIPGDVSWRRGTDALRAYIAVNGHAHVPRGHVEDAFPLGYWVHNQRKAWKNNNLSTDRVAELDALGFVWGASRGGRSEAGPVIGQS